MVKNKKIPILATAGLLATGYILWDNWKKANPTDKVNNFVYRTTGYNNVTNKFDNHNWVGTIAPAAMGVGGSMLASRTKANRYISGVPFVKF